MQAGSAVRECRQGVQEGSAGRECKKGVQAGSAGRDCRQGVQAGSVSREAKCGKGVPFSGPRASPQTFAMPPLSLPRGRARDRARARGG